MRPDDEVEFTAMVERHARFVFRIAYSLLRNPQDAEDAVQEMLLNLDRRSVSSAIPATQQLVTRSVEPPLPASTLSYPARLHQKTPHRKT